MQHECKLREILADEDIKHKRLMKLGLLEPRISLIVAGKVMPGPKYRAKIAAEVGRAEEDIWPELKEKKDGENPESSRADQRPSFEELARGGRS